MAEIRARGDRERRHQRQRREDDSTNQQPAMEPQPAGHERYDDDRRERHRQHKLEVHIVAGEWTGEQPEPGP